MIIERVLFSPGLGSFYYDDQAAIRNGRALDGFTYAGAPVTQGFSQVRLPATALSIGLVLSDGQVAWGDMMSVQYSGAGGRDPLFNRSAAQEFVRTALLDRLIGLDVQDFRAACLAVFTPHTPLAVKYGLSQALLRAAAASSRASMAEVICKTFDIPLPKRPVPILAQSGDDRHLNVDKMILKRADVLPHGLINSREKFGAKGDALREYVRWTANRVTSLGDFQYRPTLHFDVYGWIGLEFGLRSDTIIQFLLELERDAAPFALNIECPADFGSRDAQIAGYAELADGLEKADGRVKIVADEQCNTLDDIAAFAEARAGHILQIKSPDVGSLLDIAAAVMICHDNGVGAYVGGSCTETDLSARACVHVAVATQADMMLAKPGMGVDEGLSIVGNEQRRLLAELAGKA